MTSVSCVSVKECYTQQVTGVLVATGVLQPSIAQLSTSIALSRLYFRSTLSTSVTCCGFLHSLYLFGFLQDVEMKEEGTRHMLILYNIRMDMAGSVDFSAANAKSSAQLRVKGNVATFSHSVTTLSVFIRSAPEFILDPLSEARSCSASVNGLSAAHSLGDHVVFFCVSSSLHPVASTTEGRDGDGRRDGNLRVRAVLRRHCRGLVPGRTEDGGQ